MSTWILLRGLTRESRHWGEFPEMLRARVGNSQVLTLDLPGNGRLNAQPSPTRVEDMAAACREALLRRGLPPPYHLLAMSLGAMVALAWATAHAEELQGCVLINTSLRNFSPWFQRLKPDNYPRLLGLLAASDPRAIEGTVLALTACHPTQAPATLLAQWVAWRIENPVSRVNALRQLWAAARFSPPRDAPAVPMLVLAGAGDTLVDPRCSPQLAAQWGAELRMHPTAGHDLPLDDGAWVAGEVSRWLEARAQPPRKCFL